MEEGNDDEEYYEGAENGVKGDLVGKLNKSYSGGESSEDYEL